jgi:hypothetical protein
MENKMKPAYAITGWTGDYSGSEEYEIEAFSADSAEEIKSYVENRPRLRYWSNFYWENGKAIPEKRETNESYVEIINVCYGSTLIGKWRYATTLADDKTGEWEKWEPTTKVEDIK